MNNSYSPFSTAPGARAAGLSPAYHQHLHQHHASSSNSNGLLDGMHPPTLGALSPGVTTAAVVGRGGGGGMLPYPIPPPQSQQQQQHVTTVSMLNACCPTGTPTVGIPSSGPAVPAPRSAATLRAEATGAPPPPPAPSRVAGNAVAAGTLAGGINTPTAAAPLHGASSVQTVTPSLAAPEPTAAASAAALVSPTFKAFTTSAAALLSLIAEADEATGSTESTGGGVSTSTAAVAPAAATAAGATTATWASAQSAAISPHSNVEIQFTLPTAQERVSTDDGDAFGFEEDSEEDYVTDFVTQVLVSIKAADGSNAFEGIDLETRGRDWYELILDSGDAPKAAAALKAKISQSTASDLCRLLEGVASALICHNIWGTALHLGIQERATLRHLVLRVALKKLFQHRSMPYEAENYVVVLVKLLTVGWVRLKGLLDTIELCLQHDELIYIGLRIIQHSLHKSQRLLEFRAALEARPRLARRLAELYTTDPRFELDVALVARQMREIPPTIFCSAPMERSKGNSLPSPVTCMAYFGVRDEVVTGDMSGAVTLWGPPGSYRQPSAKNPLGSIQVHVRPRGVVPLPMNCVPVAMAGQRLDGQYLAIAGMPFKSRKPYSRYCGKSAVRLPSTPAPAGTLAAVDVADGAGAGGDGTGNAGAIIVITCNENSVRWNKGEIVMRPPGIALTAITAFRNSIVAVGESAVRAAATAASSGPGSGILSGNASAPHRLSFVDVMNGSVVRQIPKAHSGYITALTVLEESGYVLLSGGRDAAVKMWDPRSRDDTPVVNTALCTGVPHHETTISSIHTAGYGIITTDVYGAMAVWDIRSMTAPSKRHSFAYPIADATLIQQNRAAIATTRGIVTVSLDTLEPLDWYYDKGLCTRLLANDAGNLLFMARESMLDVFAVAEF
ncbi:hypothetical protein LSCM1_02940 [Leishmania martiniquensis]|uniref:Guanine nucleotide-binding protein subunit beta-like protein n=1 Tax=Leishmania martiniquensis TaxID=1580590 RepID=A0A836KN08_9TRYP|nr:hypothetical protein LSCM1_02940 [Leishmania martiniquensis]